MPGLTSKFFAKALHFTPAYCKDCGCGFSAVGIHPEYSAFLFASHYQFLQGSNMQELPNYRYIQAAVERCCSKNGLIVEVGCSDGSLLRLLQHVSALLPPGGHLFISIPNAASCHLLQQWHFTLKGVERLARDFGFCIIDSNIKDDFELQRAQVYCLALHRSNEYRPYFAENLINAEFERTLAALKQDDRDMHRARELNEQLTYLKAEKGCRPERPCRCTITSMWSKTAILTSSSLRCRIPPLNIR